MCAAIFAQEYPKIINNILEKHPEYLCDNKTIINICNQILTELKSENSDGNESGEISSEIPVETDLIVSQNNTDGSTGEIEIAGGIDNTLVE